MRVDVTTIPGCRPFVLALVEPSKAKIVLMLIAHVLLVAWLAAQFRDGRQERSTHD
jgi:hypothetical protein